MATCRGHWLTHASHGHLLLSGHRGHLLISQLMYPHGQVSTRLERSQAPGKASHRAESQQDSRGGSSSSTHLTLTQWKDFQRGGPSPYQGGEQTGACVVGLSMSWDRPKACPQAADTHSNISMLLHSLPQCQKFVSCCFLPLLRDQQFSCQHLLTAGVHLSL